MLVDTTCESVGDEQLCNVASRVENMADEERRAGASRRNGRRWQGNELNLDTPL